MERLQINQSTDTGSQIRLQTSGTTYFPDSGIGTLSFREPTRYELLMRHNISIEFLNRGCVVSVGCKKIAFSTIEDAMNSINKYVNNPKQEAEYWEGIFEN
jgi:hypothetical protein